ncbi:MAG: signal recognition particle receptor subunit alpha, partial [Campylobacter sp.]|nr:signal recognition particle receptor subunit alpha [Campylobacter sp.]
MFNFFKKGFDKTIEAMKSANSSNKITKENLEEMLLEADVAYEIVEEILYYLPPQNEVKKDDLKRVMKTYFMYENKEFPNAKPFVELILGVHGAGKTTTVAKLANLYKKAGLSVIFGACDTFRAGAIEQLRRWSQKVEIPIIATEQGHDPAAVAFDTVSSAIAKKIDRVLIDTAGRLQNQKNLANELEKIV